ncbi:MAG: roadblock/LC7 domain-containing protein [Desulfatitalea sp.]
MEMVLEDIKCIPGVSGVFCFNPLSGILAHKSSPGLSGETLSAVGRTLVKIYSGGTGAFPDIEQISLQYEESRILITQVTETLYLVIIHEQSLNPNLLNMTLTQALKNLKKQFNFSPDRSGADAVSQNAPVNAAAAPINKDRLTSKPVTQFLAVLETSLNKVMGPMGSVVFADTHQAWLDGADDPNRVSIEKLIRMLFAEIGDPEKINTFKKLIAPHLKSN